MVEQLSVIFDITSTYTYGSIEGLSAHGYSRDHRPDLEQVNIGLAVTKKEYVPIMHRVFEGNIPDVVTLLSTAAALRSRSDRRITLICDRGFLSDENVNMLDGLKDFDFVCGAKWTGEVTEVVDEACKGALLRPLKERSDDDKLSSCRLLRNVYGKERNVLIYHSTATHRTCARAPSAEPSAGKKDEVRRNAMNRRDASAGRRRSWTPDRRRQISG